MIQDSNAPSDMQPWVRQTESEMQALKDTVQRLSVELQNAGISSDVELNAGLDSTFTFIDKEDGTISTEAGAIEFTGLVSSSESISVDKSITVGDRVDFIEGEEGLEAGDSAPYFEVSPGSFDVNPVTEENFYSPGTFKVNDTSLDIKGYGQISGDGLAITLNNESGLAGYRAEILEVTPSVIYQQGSDWIEGDPEEEIPVTGYKIENSDESPSVIAVGNYVNITGCDPEALNENNALIVEMGVTTPGYTLFYILKDSSAITYIAGGEVSSNKPQEVYESTLSVRGPGGANDHFGATVSPSGISIGPDGGNLTEAVSVLDRDGLITPSVTALEALSVNSTRVFIQSQEPEEPLDGDLWIDPQNPANTQGSTVSVTAPITNTGTSTNANIGIDLSNIAPIASPTFTGTPTAALLRLTSTTNATTTSTGHGLQIGPTAGVNLRLDTNEVTALTNGAVSTLLLNPLGGNITLGDSSSEITIPGDIVSPTYTGDATGNRIRLTTTTDASLSSTGHAFQIGATSSTNLIMDGNEIMARNNGAVSSIFINGDGGTVDVGGDTGSFINTRAYSTSNDWAALGRTRKAAWLDSNGTLGNAASSSREVKQEISATTYEYDKIISIEPKTFKYNEAVEIMGKNAPLELGFIAEDLHDAGLTELVYYKEDGSVEGLDYTKFAVITQQIVREQHRMIMALREEVENLKAKP
jgi:hypothetical protein